MPSILDMLAEQATAQQGDGERLTDDQIVARLREYGEKLEEGHRFTPGQIVRAKSPNLDTTRNAGRPWHFVGYLQDVICATDYISDPKQLASNACTVELDCRIRVILNGVVMEYFHDSRQIEPHPDFPAAEG